MPWIKIIFAEFFSLFVDDGKLAISIIVWLAMSWLVRTYIDIPPEAWEMLLFLGLAVILLASVVNYARKNKAPPL